VIVALGVRGRAIGVMTLGTNLGGRALRPDDVEIAEQLGRRSAAAVENARLYGKLSDVAETLQRALLPSALPEVPGWEIASLYAPTESELRIDIGGDFYELIEHEGTWFAIIGDVAGKGVAAASVTALMRHGARVACRSEPEPAMILTRLDEVLLQQDGGAMATAMCLCLDADHVVGSSAGHPPAILVGPDGALREAPRPDRMLGAFPDADARHDEPIPIAEGELLLIYTDGVTDAPGRHDRFGVVRLRQLLSELAGASPQRVLARLEQELRRFSPGPGRDDIAALAMRRRS
jgi:serine phosphatase RsbU (regulator of sigma subunit)